jgi:hypothetical protein
LPYLLAYKYITPAGGDLQYLESLSLGYIFHFTRAEPACGVPNIAPGIGHGVSFHFVALMKGDDYAKASFLGPTCSCCCDLLKL